ncbi:MAG: peptidyl-alpha-hydroxyglycine alpha-amidating lyase family protein [Planctomycetes bacterium]|jgi:DNA-binding beta-propeller fold protein YncE|nr:peptidyl-alpha-hydroxyglycine alpha-amidating lyase family protein [Planctomycetota bacterium]
MGSNRCSLAVAALFPILLASVGPSVAWGQQSTPATDYAVDPAWPRKPEPFTWAQMPGITLDDQGQVYVFTRRSPAVQVYRTDGTFVRSWDIKDASGAHFIRVDPEGNIWTTDIKSHLVCKHSPDGRVLLTLGEAGRPGTDEKHFARPTDVAVLPTGDIFVSDGYDNRRVIHFDRTGKYLNQWGEAGAKPGQFALPHSIVADSHGRLYVADRENARIQVFDTRGKLLAVWADVMAPWGLYLTRSEDLWVCGSSLVKKEGTSEWLVLPPPDQVVMKLNLQGQVLLRVPLVKTAVAQPPSAVAGGGPPPEAGAPPAKPGQFDWVHGIGVDAQGNLYLGDIQGQRAQKLVRRP